jgi:hypothetical protein
MVDVDRNDLVLELIAQQVDLLLGHDVIAGIELAAAGHELVVRVRVPVRVDAFCGFGANRAYRYVDVDVGPVSGRAGVDLLELDDNLSAGVAIADVKGDRFVARRRIGRGHADRRDDREQRESQ